MDVRNRIEQFFAGTLSLEEEQELYCYLCNNKVPVEMQRDKEAVIALCEDIADYTLPEGAEKRLEAMLDELERQTVTASNNESTVEQPFRKTRKIPIPVWWGVAIAASVAIAVIISLPREKGITADKYAKYETDTYRTVVEASPSANRMMRTLTLAMNNADKNLEQISENFSLAIEEQKKNKRK